MNGKKCVHNKNSLNVTQWCIIQMFVVIYFNCNTGLLFYLCLTIMFVKPLMYLPTYVAEVELVGGEKNNSGFIFHFVAPFSWWRQLEILLCPDSSKGFSSIDLSRSTWFCGAACFPLVLGLKHWGGWKRGWGYEYFLSRFMVSQRATTQ